jgi:hypothetical protein
MQVAERQDLRGSPGGPGPYGRFGWGGVETVTTHQGSLRIDLADARRHALVCQGAASGRVHDEALGKPDAAVQKAVGEIFADFPKRTMPERRHATAPLSAIVAMRRRSSAMHTRFHSAGTRDRPRSR